MTLLGAGPARPSPAREPSRGEDPSEVHRHPALGRGSRVLLVDDDPQHRIPLLRALRDQGHSVLHAADGPAGERLCRASQFEIDALVARADMQRMGGFELARCVRRVHPGVRVLLMWRRSPGPEEARRAHGHGYVGIEEPFTPEELSRRLMGLLASSRAPAESGPDGGDCLSACEEEVLVIASQKKH